MSHGDVDYIGGGVSVSPSLSGSIPSTNSFGRRGPA